MASTMATRGDLIDLAKSELKKFRATYTQEVHALSAKVAGVNSAFAMGSPREHCDASRPFVDTVTQLTASVTAAFDGKIPKEASGILQLSLKAEEAYLRGYLEGGAAFVIVSTNFPDGDWDDPEQVEPVLLKALDFLPKNIETALHYWVETTPITPPKPAEPAPVDSDGMKTMPPVDPANLGQTLPAAPAKGPTLGDRKVRLNDLLTFGKTIGVRLKKVPSKPSTGWLDKLEAKLRAVAKKKGVPVVLPNRSPAAPTTPSPERQERIKKMVAKAKKAGLQLGKIPENPTDSWLDDIDAKLQTVLNKRKAERKAEREKKQKLRKERIARLQRQADELEVDLGRIPPFPTEDWLARAEMRIATKMLPASDKKQDHGRAEKLAALQSRASEVGFDLDVPPDPDATWFAWAESRLNDAEQGDELLAAGEDPDQVERVPTLFFEPDTIQEQTWVIEDARFTIGRNRLNNIQLPHDAQISRVHCAILTNPDGWIIEDLKSTRGTLVNGKKIGKPTALTDGDLILVGETELVFRLA